MMLSSRLIFIFCERGAHEKYGSIKMALRGGLIHGGNAELVSILSTSIAVYFFFWFFPRNFSIPMAFLSLSNRFVSFLACVPRIRLCLRSPARMHRGGSLSEPTATRLLRMHRGRDDVMRLQPSATAPTSHLLLVPPSLVSPSLSLWVHLAFSPLCTSRRDACFLLAELLNYNSQSLV